MSNEPIYNCIKEVDLYKQIIVMSNEPIYNCIKGADINGNTDT